MKLLLIVIALLIAWVALKFLIGFLNWFGGEDSETPIGFNILFYLLLPFFLIREAIDTYKWKRLR